MLVLRDISDSEPANTTASVLLIPEPPAWPATATRAAQRAPSAPSAATHSAFVPPFAFGCNTTLRSTLQVHMISFDGILFPCSRMLLALLCCFRSFIITATTTKIILCKRSHVLTTANFSTTFLIRPVSGSSWKDSASHRAQFSLPLNTRRALCLGSTRTTLLARGPLAVGATRILQTRVASPTALSASCRVMMATRLWQPLPFVLGHHPCARRVVRARICSTGVACRHARAATPQAVRCACLAVPAGALRPPPRAARLM